MYTYLKRIVQALLSFWLLTIITAHVVKQNNDILFWSKSRLLTFADFQGTPDKADTTIQKTSAKEMIHTLGAITKSIDVHLVKERTRTVFTIYAGMDKKLSWIKTNNDTTTLKHEQGHFDICEIYARLLRKAIRNVKSLSEAKELYNKISDAENIEQDNFDKVNTFLLGGITDSWKDSINTRLKDLAAYENPIVILSIVK